MEVTGGAPGQRTVVGEQQKEAKQILPLFGDGMVMGETEVLISRVADK